MTENLVSDTRELMRRSGLTYEEMHQLVGRNPSLSWIQKFGRGAVKNPTLDKITRLRCRLLERAA